MKKLTCVLLSLFLISSNFILANASQPSTTKAQNAKSLFNSLGICQVSERGETEPITRGEFVYALAEIVKCASYSARTTPTFTDVSATDYIFGAVEYAVSMGIISPDVTFNPNDPISIDAATKMAVVLIGRNHEAIKNGGWTKGYSYIATQCKLYKNLSLNSQDLTYGDYYIFLRNICEAETVEVNTIEDSRLTYAEENTLFEIYYDLYEVKGRIDGNEFTGLYSSSSSLGKGCISVEGNSYLYDGDYTLGANIEGYATDVDGAPTLVYYELKDTTYTTIALRDVLRYDGTKLYYNDSQTTHERSVKIDSDYALIYNGKAYPILTLDDVVGKTNGTLTLVIDERANGASVALVNEYYTMYVKSVNVYDEVIYDENGMLPLDLSDNLITYHISTADDAITLDLLQTGSIISVYVSQDGSLINIYVNDNVIEGTLNSMYEVDGVLKYVVDDNEYYISDYYDRFYKNSAVLGASYTFMLTDDGVIQTVIDTATGVIHYGYIVNVYLPEDSGDDDAYVAKMFTDIGKLGIYPLAKKVNLNGVSQKTRKSVSDFFKKSGEMAPSVMRYSLNAMGELNMIDTPSGTAPITGNEDPYNRMSGFEWPANVQNPYYSRAMDMFDVYLGLNSDTRVFYIDSNKSDAKMLSVESLAFLRSNAGSFSKAKDGTRTYYAEAYDVTDTGVASLMVVRPTSSKTQGGFGYARDRLCGVVTSISSAVNLENEVTIRMVIFTGAGYKTYYFDDDLFNEYTNTGAITYYNGMSFTPKKGDVVYFKTDPSEVNLNALWLAYRDSEVASEREYHLDILSPSSHYDESFFIGEVENIGDGIITVIGDTISKEPNNRIRLKLSGNVIVSKDGAKEVYAGEQYDIVSAKANPGNASRVFIATDEIKPTTIVVFK